MIPVGSSVGIGSSAVIPVGSSVGIGSTRYSY